MCTVQNVSAAQRKTKKKAAVMKHKKIIWLCIPCNPPFSPGPQQQKLEIMSLDTPKTTKSSHTPTAHTARTPSRSGTTAKFKSKKSALIVNTLSSRESAFVSKRPSGCCRKASAQICDLSAFYLCGEPGFWAVICHNLPLADTIVQMTVKSHKGLRDATSE